MKKIIFPILALLLIAGSSCQEKIDEVAKTSVEENKKIANLYHDRNLEDVDKVLTEDFIGHFYLNETNPSTWNRANHRKSINNNPSFKDTILVQIAEGEWVATRFIRSGIYQGRPVKVEVMGFKRFENGKIAEIWEIFGPLPEEEEVEEGEAEPETEE